MFIDILLIIVGLWLVLRAADLVTKGSVGLAGRLGVSQMVIGLTVVALGTSLPEFCVSLTSALKGSADLAVANVVGSNIFNAMLIVGVAAIVAPIVIRPSTVKKDIPFACIASILLLLMCLNGKVSRWEALVLLLMLAVFMFITLRGARQNTSDEPAVEVMPTKKIAGFIVLGLIGLAFGSYIFVDGATNLASRLGVSDAVIGLTVVAGGTSLPELATSVVAAKKGNGGIAIGNVLGSNVLNILFILGITGLITPLQIEGLTTVDFSMMIISMLLLWLFSFTKYRLSRWEGILLSAIFLGYIVYLIQGVM